MYWYGELVVCRLADRLANRLAGLAGQVGWVGLCAAGIESIDVLWIYSYSNLYGRASSIGFRSQVVLRGAMSMCEHRYIQICMADCFIVALLKGYY